MPRLQVTISDELDEILLNAFECSADKRRFIEKAIKLALENEELCSKFVIKPCTQTTTTISKPSTINYIENSQISRNADTTEVKKETTQIQFDPEFDN